MSNYMYSSSKRFSSINGQIKEDSEKHYKINNGRTGRYLEKDHGRVIIDRELDINEINNILKEENSYITPNIFNKAILYLKNSLINKPKLLDDVIIEDIESPVRT